jgi:putative ABC transport system permease protein
MLKNYFKIALRNINRQKVYTGINILGLAIGMAGAMFILLWVWDELNYDRFHKNADRIYRVYQVFNYGDYHLEQTQTPGILATKLKEKCHEVELVTRVRGFREELLVIADKRKFNERGLGIADESFFQLFSFPLVIGNPQTILKEPHTVAISEKAARKYFGDSEVVGRTLTIFDEDFVVSGVFKDMPNQSHFHLDVLCSFASFERYQQPAWGINVFKTYVLLREGNHIEALENKLTDIVKNDMFDSPERYETVTAKGDYTKFLTQPLTNIHLKSHLLWEFEVNGNGTYVKFFTIIALFILLIAAINYINLVTARSASRTREVGIRKTVGSTRASLIRQFLIESVLTSFFALILSLSTLHIFMPAFRNLVGKPWLQIPYMENPLLLFPLILLTVLIGSIAGMYPAFFLSSFKPVAVLSGKSRGGINRSRLRNGLVVFQFSLSILLLVATLVVQKQMNFIQTHNLGYDQEQVMVIQTYGELGQKLPVLRELLLHDPSIEAVSASSSVPGGPFTNIGMGLEGTDSNQGTNMYIADADFQKTMKIEMMEGRFFSEGISTDESAVILNESEASKLGVQDLLGKRMRIWVGGEGMELFHIIGIVKDFHYESFHEPVKPLVMVMLHGVCPWPEAYVSVRIRTSDVQKTLAQIRKTWEDVVPGTPFEYSFLDSIYDAQYQNEVRTSLVFTIFTLFAIFVACIGLLGLASYAVEQRTKEIGIRKVVGASVQDLVLMLSGEFTRWIALANLIAWPAAYYLMSQWLYNFAYRTTIGILPFIITMLISIGVAFFTVSYHALKASLTNPVESLRYE